MYYHCVLKNACSASNHNNAINPRFSKKPANYCAMNERVIYQIPATILLFGLILIPAIWLAFGDGIAEIIKSWEREEYSYGYMIPFIAAFLVWQQKDRLEKLPFPGSWGGVITVLFGVTLYVVGSLSAVVDIQSYGFIVTILGIALSYTGPRAFRLIAVPLAVLLFMVPLPGFLYQSLSNELQLISSRIGVWVIRLFDISVFLEGNVIDLGAYKLQVVEACSGLRYLFPLTTLSFIAAYFFKVALWKRALVFISSIPITVLMNSFRIGVIGVTVEYWGVGMAEGFLHDFEGWVVFMASLVVLILEMIVLAMIGKDNRPFSEVFGLEMPEPSPTDAVVQKRAFPLSFIVSAFLVGVAASATYILPERVDVVPTRESFALFPDKLGEWHGKHRRMEQIYVDALNFDDYLMSDYTRSADKSSVNLYIGYYDIQRADKVPHSPRACLPGGGWAITESETKKVDGVSVGRAPLLVNRVIIERENYKQLVYYWFEQRDRVITNEWMVKWYLLVDSISKSRTDGALVRLTTLLRPGEDIAEGDARLRDFAVQVAPMLPRFVPD